MRFLTPEGMREADRRTIEGGIAGSALMEAAGRAVAQEVWRAYPHRDWSVAVLCGSGNNGGDGFVAARDLHRRYRRVQLFLAGEVERLRGDAREAAEAYQRNGGEVTTLSHAAPFRDAVSGCSLLVDALLGTGSRGEVSGLYRELLQASAGFGGPVVAVDAPSGLDMATGRLLGPAPKSALTVTFGAAKLGHVLGEGPDHTGRLVVRGIGLAPAALAQAAARADSARSLEPREVERLLPLPSRRAHKRSTGVVAVVAGSRAYAGAAALTCLGALRAGAGLVHALVPESLKAPLTALHPEAIVTALPPEPDGSLGSGALEPLREALRSVQPDALVVGPGLGAGEATGALVRELAATADGTAALLLDADGLNAFAGRRRELGQAAARLALALTPHPGELGRLLDLSGAEVDDRRVELARETAAELGCAILLKGAPSVVCAPGAGTVLNLTGNAGLARGGTGDLLSGIVGAFLAKRLAPPDALALGAFAHGLAADLAREELGTLSMTASDVGERLAPVLRAVEKGETRAMLRRARSAYGDLAGELQPPKGDA